MPRPSSPSPCRPCPSRRPSSSPSLPSRRLRPEQVRSFLHDEGPPCERRAVRLTGRPDTLSFSLAGAPITAQKLQVSNLTTCGVANLTWTGPGVVSFSRLLWPLKPRACDAECSSSVARLTGALQPRDRRGRLLPQHDLHCLVRQHLQHVVSLLGRQPDGRHVAVRHRSLNPFFRPC